MNTALETNTASQVPNNKKKIIILCVIIVIVLTIVFALIRLSNNPVEPLEDSQDIVSIPVSGANSDKPSTRIINNRIDTFEDTQYYFDSSDKDKVYLLTKSISTGEVNSFLTLDPFSLKFIQSISPDGKYLVIVRTAQYVGGLRFNIYNTQTKELVANLAPYQVLLTWTSNNTFLYTDSGSICTTISLSGESSSCERAELIFKTFNAETSTASTIYKFPSVEGRATNAISMELTGDNEITAVVEESELKDNVDTLVARHKFVYNIADSKLTEN